MHSLWISEDVVPRTSTLSIVAPVPVKCKVHIIFSKLIWYSKVFNKRVDWTFCWTINCLQHHWYVGNNTRRKTSISSRFLIKLDFLFAHAWYHCREYGVSSSVSARSLKLSYYQVMYTLGHACSDVVSWGSENHDGSSNWPRVGRERPSMT